jgi:hypothetical protein
METTEIYCSNAAVNQLQKLSMNMCPLLAGMVE